MTFGMFVAAERMAQQIDLTEEVTTSMMTLE
jgi:hypothetical protein